LGYRVAAAGESRGDRERCLEGDLAFKEQIWPLLADRCVTCHSEEKQKGELDLEPLATLDQARRHPKIWQSIAEQLENNEMPPKKEPQLSAEEKERLIGWIRGTLDAIGRERAGDAGPVVLRRLSNAEYTYTLRDLTGVESLNAAREFPVDGASGEGFTNSGQGLVMSPALITKYLDAAKEVASHAVLLPDGIRFSPAKTRHDRTEELLGRIREFYSVFTEDRRGESVNLQGLVFETNGGGRLPLEKYFAATLEDRESIAAGEKTGKVSAAERGLNARYYEKLLDALTKRKPSLLLGGLRQRWRDAAPGDARALVSYVEHWQKVLWKFNSVGQIGRVSGPKAWLEAVTPSPDADPLKALISDFDIEAAQLESAFEDFRELFPPALCYSQIVPVDEVVTLTLFYREDEHLAKLMLSEEQKRELDRLWEELHFVSEDALTLVDAFAQLVEYTTQDGDPTLLEPLRGPVAERASAFRQRLLAAEPQHVDWLVKFAERAYRRPLIPDEESELRALYHKLRTEELPHEEAIRLTLARVLVAPAFLYRAENPGPAKVQVEVNDWELASRLSYFLWSSEPDEELRQLAAAGKLREPEILVSQARRMLQDARVRRLATEFACQWLHLHDFESLDEKSERHFPTFRELRGPMYEESIRFFTDFFTRDQPVLSILDADHTFVNGALAKHYGVSGVEGDTWQRVDGMKQRSRGGILGQAATLARQSGASRTSPILRGNWVAEALLGDKLPKPPKDVPQLPEEEGAADLTVRQLTEKHTTDPRCYGCHSRIDAFGFALESFDAIGVWRDRDLAGRAIDNRATVADGSDIAGLDGLRSYLLNQKRDAFLRQFSRKLTGYALGRAVQLSDETLLAQIQQQLKANDYRVSAAIETIVLSRPFREIRGRETNFED
jgi:hypothetical protein